MSQTSTNLTTWLPPEGVDLCRHSLAVAFRFVDPFVDAAPPVPPFRRAAVADRFVVRIDSLEWEARFAASDGSYRFGVANVNADIEWHSAVILGIPTALFPAVPVPLLVDVQAEEPERARYFVPSPISVSLPVPGPFVTPAQQLGAFLREVEAYPTPLFRAPPGETCVRGVVRDNADIPRAGAEVALFDGGGLPATAVFTRTDADGFFAYRLPWLKRPSPIPAEPSLGISVRHGGAVLGTVEADPSPGADPARALFAYGVTTSVGIRAF